MSNKKSEEKLLVDEEYLESFSDLESGAAEFYKAMQGIVTSGFEKYGRSKPLQFPEYLDMVMRAPHLEEPAVARFWRMIESGGITPHEVGPPTMEFFSGKFFGLRQELWDIFGLALRSMAQAGQGSLHALALWGPPSSGKDYIVRILMEGMVDFSRPNPDLDDDSIAPGAKYAIGGCDSSCSPLYLIPPGHGIRRELFEKYGIRVLGDLCPWCRRRFLEIRTKIEDERNDWNLKHYLDYVAQQKYFEINRVVFSPRAQKGYAVYFPGHPRYQRPDDLVGGLSITGLARTGDPSHPDSWNRHGAIFRAPPGILHMQEGLRARPDMLQILLLLQHEKKVVTGTVGSTYPDVFTIITSNAPNVLDYMNDPYARALVSRFKFCRLPYTVDPEAGSRAVSLMIESNLDLFHKRAHIAPLAIKICMYAAGMHMLQGNKSITNPISDDVDDRRKRLEIIMAAEALDVDGMPTATEDEWQAYQELRVKYPENGMNESIGFRDISADVIEELLSDLVASSAGSRPCVTELRALERLKKLSRINPPQWLDEQSALALDRYTRGARDWWREQIYQEMGTVLYPDSLETQLEILLRRYIDAIRKHLEENESIITSSVVPINNHPHLVQAVEIGVGEPSASRAWRENLVRLAHEKGARLEVFGEKFRKALYTYLLDSKFGECWRAFQDETLPGHATQVQRVENLVRLLGKREDMCEHCARERVEEFLQELVTTFPPLKNDEVIGVGGV